MRAMRNRIGLRLIRCSDTKNLLLPIANASASNHSFLSILCSDPGRTVLPSIFKCRSFPTFRRKKKVEMLKTLQARASSAAHAFGYDIHKSQDRRSSALFSSLGIDLLIDIGANRGQYALARRASGYQGEILSFEPLSTAHTTLRALSSNDPNWTIADRVAVGDRSGEIEINLAQNSASSSVLPMLDAHLAAAPHSRYIGKEAVPLRRLDDLLESTVGGRKIFLKLDVQGFESYVLHGAEHVLQKTLALQLEMSLLPLYQGETLMPEMCQLLREKGFELWDLEPGFRDPSTGRLLQVDAIFTRQDVASV
jgi:FkbM family methyltransferase